MKKLNASEVAALLDEIGNRLELAGEASFKRKAYHRAAESLRRLPEPLADIIGRSELRSIEGVGPAIEEKIQALHTTGTHRTLERLRADFPSGVLELLAVPKLGAEKAAILYRELGVAGLDDLEEACKLGRLATLKGFGPSTQERLIEGVAFARKREHFQLMHHAAERLDSACTRLKSLHPNLERVIPAGDVRRGCEIVSDLIIAACCGSEIPAITADDLPTVYAAPRDRFGLAFLYATGSEAHLADLQAAAQSRGMMLTETALLRGTEVLPCRDEHDVYAALGMGFIEPELREGRGEVVAALAGRLPALVSDEDIRGVLHSHTDASDGSSTLEDMAEAARSRGYVYFGVCDHSQTAAYAGGLKAERVREQHKLVEKLNGRYLPNGFRIFKGIESDIRADGSLDYPDEVLKSFDFIVASVHGRFSLDRDAQTDRIVSAVSNPYTTILGHMTGRLLLSREGYDADVETILSACAENGVVVEINADPHRLDLDWRWHQRALDIGCMLSIHPDAHSTGDIDMIKWGVKMARKGGVPKERLLCCMDLDNITEYFYSRHVAALNV